MLPDGQKQYEVQQALDGKKPLRLCPDCTHYRKGSSTALGKCFATAEYVVDNKGEPDKRFLATGDVTYLVLCSKARETDHFCGTEGKLFIEREVKPTKKSFWEKLFG